jgi:hypothetical protein
MLNIGLIGKISSIEHQIEKLNKYPDIRIQGKSSVGIKNQSSDYRFSIPEYNRVELIERSDAIFLEDSTLIPYALIKESIKRRKHIYFAEYPEFSENQCNELIKLIDEAGTVVQIKNPLYYNSLLQYVIKNITLPFYLNIDIIKEKNDTGNSIVTDIILMILKMGQAFPKKTKAISINHSNNMFKFQNIRLEFSDSSILELNISNSEEDKKFVIKAISEVDVFEINLLTNHLSAKSGLQKIKNIDTVKEYESFFKTIIKKQLPLTGFSEFLIAKKTVNEINGK